jgi:hypothetical protein
MQSMWMVTVWMMYIRIHRYICICMVNIHINCKLSIIINVNYMIGIYRARSIYIYTIYISIINYYILLRDI